MVPRHDLCCDVCLVCWSWRNFCRNSHSHKSTLLCHPPAAPQSCKIKKHGYPGPGLLDARRIPMYFLLEGFKI